MPGIRLAATVAVTFKAEDTMNDLPADEAAEAFRDSLQADLAQVYGDVEAIEVGGALIDPAVNDPRLALDIEALRTCHDVLEVALDDLAAFGSDQQRLPREVEHAVATAMGRYRRAVRLLSTCLNHQLLGRSTVGQA